MALDSALFTLHFVRRHRHPWIVDLYHANLASVVPPPVPPKDNRSAVDDDDSRKPKPFSGTIPDHSASRDSDSIDYTKLTPLYTRHRATNSARYSAILLDGLLSDCLLASVDAPSTSARSKSIQLHNPESITTLEKRQKTFHQDWRFTVNDNLFQWRKESSARASSSYFCQVIRKPDPNVLVAQYRPSTKSKAATLQLMDYNLDRLDVDDKRGLELLLVMTLSTLLDQEYDERCAQNGEPNIYISRDAAALATSAAGVGDAMAAMHNLAASTSAAGASGPSPSTSVGGGSVMAAWMAAASAAAELDPNEVLVNHWGTVEDYVDHCLTLLRADEVPGEGKGRAMYMIVLRSDSVETASKTVQVAAAVKAAYYRLPDEAKGTVYGNSSSQQEIQDELYQYVRTEDATGASAAPSSSQQPQPGTSLSSAALTAAAPGPKRRIIKLDPPKASSPRSGSLASASATSVANGATNGGAGASASSASGSSAGARASYLLPPPSKLHVILSKERIGELEPPKQPEAFDPTLQATFGSGDGAAGLPAWMPTRPPRPPAQAGGGWSEGERPSRPTVLPGGGGGGSGGSGRGSSEGNRVSGGSSGQQTQGRSKGLLSKFGIRSNQEG
ncbi:hypothetical protein ACQY0O_000672 [Thecaphora frezii]